MSQKSKALAVNQDYDVAVTARHMSISDAMKQHVIDKLGKIDRFHTRIADVSVTMDLQRELNIVDIVLKANNFRVRSHAATNDMYVSIDMAVEKIQAQLRRYKTRLVRHQAKGLKEVDMTVNVIRPSDPLNDLNSEIEEETVRELETKYKPHEIVKTETRTMKILTYNEAVMKMELSGDHFLVFRHQEDMKTKIIYRRTDGDYAVMETQ